MLGIAGLGVVSYRALPVSDLPNVDFPTLNVGAGLPGGDPGTMASAVASPLERQFTTISGIDEMTSSSSTGSSNVTLQFDHDRNIDSAAVDVQTAIAAVMPLLPAGMPAPPSFRKFNPADSPIGEDVPAVDAESRTAPVHRDRRRLHRAGHAVRELHPPDHDSLGTAVGGARRARDAVSVRQ